MTTYILYRFSNSGENEIVLSNINRRKPNDQNYGYSIWSLCDLKRFGWTVIGIL